MKFHKENEKALIEKFRQNRGELIVFFRDMWKLLQCPNNPVITDSEAKALSLLIRSGHIESVSSGDFNWVRYRLKRKSAPTPANDSEPT